MKQNGVDFMRESMPGRKNLDLDTVYQADLRYKGQALTLTVDLT